MKRWIEIGLAAGVLVSWWVLADSPGDHYPGSGSTVRTNAPYARPITVYGSVTTNDVVMFMDRTGLRVRGSNVLASVGVANTNWQAAVSAEAASRAAGDVIANTNLQAAITAEAVARAAGDVIANTNWQAAVTAEAVARAAGDVVAKTNLQAKIDAEVVLRAAGDLVAMTNWQAIVYSLTNGAALGATAVQRSGDTMTGTLTAPGVTIDASNARTNTYGGAFTILGAIIQSGIDTAATGAGSHSEGMLTTASGAYSHAEGVSTTASGDYSHSEGGLTTASGDYSHSEGIGTIASGDHSHAAGLFSTASHASSWSWSGQGSSEDPYLSNGDGTFNIDPIGGISGVYIGSLTLASLLSGATSSVPAQISSSISDHAAASDPHGDRAYADALLVSAPVWQGITNLSASVIITNVHERPTYLYTTGTVSLAFSGMRSPAPMYLVVAGADSLSVPGAHLVGGGSWQTNQANHFLVWQYGTNLFLNPITTTTED